MSNAQYRREREDMPAVFHNGSVMTELEVSAMLVLIRHKFIVSDENIRELAKGCFECVRPEGECVCEC
jgi:hypothetical protein